MGPEPNDATWRHLLAIGLVAGDITPTGVARAAHVHLAEAEVALSNARDAGVLGADDEVDELDKIELIANLPEQVVAEVHAAVARRRFAEGPEGIVDAIAHARAAGRLVGLEEMVSMADHGGRTSLSVGDYSSARQLLELAVELDTSGDFADQGRRLCDLATALDGVGDVAAARHHLGRAVTLGELAHDPALVVRAAVQHALPADWYAGDPATSGLLRRAEEVAERPDEFARIRAARAFTENRIPLSNEDGQQFAWVARAATAQRFADEAIEMAKGCDPRTRLLALMSWRTTHRGPRHLMRRREVSMAALQLAEEIRDPSLQVEAAIALSVDALESADRALYDQSLAVVRWVAERDGNPRLLWRARTTVAGGLYLDGEFDRGAEEALRAQQVGESVEVPGWLGAAFFFEGQHAISLDDPERMPAVQMSDDFLGLLNPIGRAGVAFMLARCGQHERAESYVRRALRQLDEEASYLMLATRLAAAAVELDTPDLHREIADILLPWVSHVSLDSHAWCCDGPVSVWVAMLLHRLGDDEGARRELDRGEPVARALNDVRSMRRVRLLREFLPEDSAGSAAHLTERELDVLRLLATGATNPQIAASLAYSVSTVRNETVSIYRKLGVRGRAEAVSKAASQGLLKA
jgi:DNA-binding CsgD family transcriptional regulator